MSEYVFGYASLVAVTSRLATLHGYRRVWGVAMDNRVAVPGYKVYETPSGVRPAVSVAFLDLEPRPETTVTGALLDVAEDDLRVLDDRERQYRRADVTTAVTPPPAAGARVWTYIGREAGRARVRHARHDGGPPVVIQRAYADQVDRAFRTLGTAHYAHYLASTEPPPFPLRELARVDLPA